MYRLISLCVDTTVAAAALAFPFWGLNRARWHDGKRTVLCYVLAVYLCAMFSLVGLPDIRYIRFDVNINLVPFRYFFTDNSTALNVLLFVPLGLLLPLLWQRFGKWHSCLAFGLGTSLLIELLQIFTLRTTDINDLITNTFGTLLGWCMARGLLWLLPGCHPSPQWKDVWVVCALSVGFMILLHPILADPLWALVLA